MKRKAIILSLVLCVFTSTSFAQQALPKYIDVLRNFFYDYSTPGDDTYLHFAKKKEGWYIQQIDYTEPDKIASELLYYSIKDNKYNRLDSLYTIASEENIDDQIEKYFENLGNSADWYSYDHLRYYGYQNWADDMIQDFGNKNELNDTLVEGLGRAWFSKTLEYLEKERKNSRLRTVSLKSIESAKSALNQDLLQYEKLNSNNPYFETKVGYAHLKLFNEYMFGFCQFSVVGEDTAARRYLEKATVPEAYLNQAKNYLNSCPPNAILFTYGDNDTYLLWYMQEKFNFRKDITVINFSLLNSPAYVAMLKNTTKVKLHVPDTFLDDEGSDVAYHKEDSGIDEDATVNMAKLLELIYTGKYSHESGAYKSVNNASYPYLKASLQVGDVVSSPNTSLPVRQVTIELKSYLLLSDIIMFDIISSNISKRPVCFTSDYDNPFVNNLLKQGIIFLLTSKDITIPAIKTEQIKALEKYIHEKYIPVISDGSTILNYDGDGSFFRLYSILLDYYLKKKDIIKFKEIAEKFTSLYSEIRSSQIWSVYPVVELLLEGGYADAATKFFEQMAKELAEVYRHPDALKGFYSKKTTLDFLNRIKDVLMLKNISSTAIEEFITEIE